MYYRMEVVQRQITDRHAEAEEQRLAKSIRQTTPNSGGWNPFRMLKQRRTQPARA
jgi:hypothetical protein